MNQSIQLISPVDGSIYAERRYASDAEIGVALSAAALAQQQWKHTALAERAALCTRMVDAMLAMRDEIVPELAWPTGRPLRSGAGDLRGFAARARHMLAIAAPASAPIETHDQARFRRSTPPHPIGTITGTAPWDFPSPNP